VSSHWTRELEYVGDLARAWADGVAGTVPAPPGIDGAALARLLARQKALATLAGHLDPAALPDPEREQLLRLAEVSRRRSTLLLLELQRLLPHLEAVGCRPVALKGAALALTAYRRPEDRWFLDLDLWIPGDQVATARRKLQDLGYRLVDPVFTERYYRRHHFHEILLSAHGICIELHWALTLPGSVYDHDLDALARDAGSHPLGRAQVRTAAAADQILHGVLQSIAGGFGDLRRILDLHLLHAGLQADALPALIARARRANAAAGLWLHYHVRQEILGAPVPEPVTRHCRPSERTVRTMLSLDPVALCLGARPQPAEVHTRLLHWLCTPRPLRVREFGRYLWPGEADVLEARREASGGQAPATWARLWVERLANTTRILGRLSSERLTG
jgi:hypothetical protein